jgi:hypothetical protein
MRGNALIAMAQEKENALIAQVGAQNGQTAASVEEADK